MSQSFDRAPRCGVDSLTEKIWPVQTHLSFGWMHVAVEGEGIHGNAKHGQRVASFGECLGIGFAEGLEDGWALDHTAVEDDELELAVGSALARSGDQALDADAVLPSRFELHKAAGEAVSKKVADPDNEIRRGCGMPELAAVPGDRHGNFRVGEGEGLHLMDDAGRLGFLATKKLFSCRDIMEQCGDLDCRSRRLSAVCDGFYLAAVHKNFRACLVAVSPRREAEP